VRIPQVLCGRIAAHNRKARHGAGPEGIDFYSCPFLHIVVANDGYPPARCALERGRKFFAHLARVQAVQIPITSGEAAVLGQQRCWRNALRPLRAHQQHGSAAVADARGVSSGHGAILSQDRLERWDSFWARQLRSLIFGDEDGGTFFVGRSLQPIQPKGTFPLCANGPVGEFERGFVRMARLILKGRPGISRGFVSEMVSDVLAIAVVGRLC
jgi:hypothetical protein